VTRQASLGPQACEGEAVNGAQVLWVSRRFQVVGQAQTSTESSKRCSTRTHLQSPAACEALLRAIMPYDVVVAQQSVLGPQV
jgi:hypothetical protein